MSWDPLTSELELLAPPPGYGTKPIGQSFYANPHVRLGRWAWTSDGWKWRGNATGPPLTIQSPAFVTVPGHSEMLYFLHYQYFTTCICDNTPIQVSETWTWNGHVFKQVHPKANPIAFPATVVSDPSFGVVAMVESVHGFGVARTGYHNAVTASVSSTLLVRMTQHSVRSSRLPSRIEGRAAPDGHLEVARLRTGLARIQSVSRGRIWGASAAVRTRPPAFGSCR